MKGTENRDERRHEQILQELFRQATVREKPPREDEKRIRTALRAQWVHQSKGRRRRNRLLFAAAASIAIAAFMASTLMRAPSPVVPGIRTASLEVVRGEGRLHAADSETVSQLEPGMTVETGQQLSTAYSAGLSLLWNNGIALRVDQSTRIEILSETEIRLLSGRVYIDTDRTDNPPAQLSVATPAGTVRHLGTRYMVAVALGSTRVSVREGRVLLGIGDEQASAGERLVLSASGASRRETIPTFGSAWEWTEALAMPFSTDGRTVAEFLAWVERESGRNVKYRTPAAERLARETRLRGNVDLGPMQALGLVMQGTDLASEVREETIFVFTGSRQ